MTAPYDPRANQKQRTRAAIVEAAAELLRQGGEPTVAAAAVAAKVSRATAYRYFPTPESLQLEVAGITPQYAPVERLVETLAGDDVEARLKAFTDLFNATTFADETRMRMALKVYQEIWFASRGADSKAPTVREGRRMRWLAQVLAPARKKGAAGAAGAAWKQMEAAVALTVGADAMVVMKDVCRLDDREAQDALRWAAQTLLRAGLAEIGAAKPPKRR